jgi:hypothetical protein
MEIMMKIGGEIKMKIQIGIERGTEMEIRIVLKIEVMVLQQRNSLRYYVLHARSS